MLRISLLCISIHACYIGASFVALSMLTGFLFQSVASLFVVATLMGTGFVYYNVSIQNLAGSYGEVTGLRLTANNVARIIVPLVGGALGAAFGAAPVFWMNGLNLVAVSWLARR